MISLNFQSFTFIDLLVTSVYFLVGYLVFAWLKIQLERIYYFGKVPGPSTWNPFLGHLSEIMSDIPMAPQKRWAEKYGRDPNYKGFIKYQGMFGRAVLLVLDPKCFRHILSTKSYAYKKSQMQNVVKEVVGENGLLVIEGKHHQRIRRLLNPVFNLKYLKNMVGIFSDFAVQLKDKWGNEVDQHGGEAIIDIHEDATKATLDVIGVAAFDFDFGALKKNSTTLYEAYNIVVHFFLLNAYFIIRFIFPPFKHLNLPPEQRFRSAQGMIEKTVEEIINTKKLEYSEGMEGRESLLTILLKELEMQNDSLTDIEVRDQVLTFLGAGHETTAVALSWSLLLLAQHPKTQNKLRGTLVDLPDSALTFDELNNLKYLGYVVNEILRIRPPAPFLMREASQDDVINDVFIPKGTTLVLFTGITQLDKNLWGDDAEVFNPERWANLQAAPDANDDPSTLNSTFHPYQYLPFSAGPKGCIGRQFALVELKCLLAVLIKNFHFKVVEGDVVVPEQTITLRPSPTVRLRVTRTASCGVEV